MNFQPAASSNVAPEYCPAGGGGQQESEQQRSLLMARDLSRSFFARRDCRLRAACVRNTQRAARGGNCGMRFAGAAIVCFAEAPRYRKYRIALQVRDATDEQEPRSSVDSVVSGKKLNVCKTRSTYPPKDSRAYPGQPSSTRSQARKARVVRGCENTTGIFCSGRDTCFSNCVQSRTSVRRSRASGRSGPTCGRITRDKAAT